MSLSKPGQYATIVIFAVCFLGAAANSIAGDKSPGTTIGFTYYDMQYQGAVGRQVEWRSTPQIHFAYTFAPSFDPDVARTIGYNVYDPIDGIYPMGLPGCDLTNVSANQSGFCSIDVLPGYPEGGLTWSGLVMGADVGANAASDGLRTDVYWDENGLLSSDYCSDVVHNRIDDALEDLYYTDGHLLWPKIEYHIIGVDTFTYAVSVGNDPSAVERPVVFWRVSGRTGAGHTWQGQIIGQTYGPTQNVVASRLSSKVAVCYTVPAAGEPEASALRDVVYCESTDMGATFGPEMNITNGLQGEPGYRAWRETAGLYDESDNLHIVWNAAIYDGAQTLGRRSRILHYSEASGVVSTVHAAQWAPGECEGGFGVFNVGRITMAECDSKLYTFWVQYNDRDAGILDDCFAGPDPSSAANGDIYLAVSNNMGYSWDRGRDLTQSRTPGCDSATGVGGACADDEYVTVSRYGMDDNSFGTALSFPAIIIDPSGGYAGSQFIDMMYLEDEMPGAAPLGEGDYTRNDITWARVACVEPVIAPDLVFLPDTLYDTLTHGQETTVRFGVENVGNETLSLSNIHGVAIDGPAGWLASVQSSLMISTGPSGQDSIDIILNQGGVINQPGNTLTVTGEIQMNSNGPDYTIPVVLTVVGGTPSECLAYGDVNGDDAVNVTDLTFLIDWLFLEGEAPDSIWEADLNGDCIIDTLDAYALTCVLFQGCPTPVSTCCDPTPIVYGQGASVGRDTAYALGGAAVVVQNERTLQINNVGGSGRDGIRLQVSDSTRTIATKLDNINLNQDSAGFRLNILAHVSDPAKEGQTETQWVSLIGAFNQIGYIEVLANFNALGDPNVTMMVYQNKVPVGQVVIPDGGLIAIGTEGIPSIGLPACTTVVLHADTPPTFILYFNKLIRFETVAGPIMFGDELRVIAANATRTLNDINAFDINGYYLGWFALTDWEAAQCCWGFTGNTDYDLVDLVDLSDLIYLVNFLFLGGPMPVCMPEANVTGDLDCAVDLSDLIHLVNFLFLGGPVPEPCLQECDEGP